MNSTITVTRLQTSKTALGRTRVVANQESASVAPGEILLRVARFALTANNITYAAYGNAMMKYWAFFPTGDDAWGHMPVWGFADVVASAVEGIVAGERFYGYFPIASHIRMQPQRVTTRGFYDDTPHRRELISAYNQYARCSDDPVYSGARENQQMLLRPLFITSFMLADFLTDNAYFGASQLLFASASSKTAYGTAWCLKDQAPIAAIAATSARNRDFVASLGCYDRVVSYEEIETLRAEVPTVYVDFSGDVALRTRVHRHFGGALTYDCLAGSAQTTELPKDLGLPGPEPKFYFAPFQLRKRNSDWGPDEVNRRINTAQLRFIEQVSDPQQPWLSIQENAGMAAAQKLIADLHDGKVDPHAGLVVRLDATESAP